MGLKQQETSTVHNSATISAPKRTPTPPQVGKVTTCNASCPLQDTVRPRLRVTCLLVMNQQNEKSIINPFPLYNKEIEVISNVT